MEMKEQGACALWSLAGSTKKQQKYIAERIGISQLMDMLLLASEKLQYVGTLKKTYVWIMYCRDGNQVFWNH